MPQRPSASVYRRRRLVALIALVAVVALAWWGIAALTGGGDPSTQTTTPPPGTSTPAATPATTTTPDTSASSDSTDAIASPTFTNPPACTSSGVSVTARTDARSYPADAQPQLSLRLENTSDDPCTIDVGTGTQVYTITTGVDTVWVSTHCQHDPTTEFVQLEPGQIMDAPPIPWVREHSAPDTCDAPTRPAAGGGGASYYLTASIGGITSAPTSFVLH